MVLMSDSVLLVFVVAADLSLSSLRSHWRVFGGMVWGFWHHLRRPELVLYCKFDED